MRKLGLDNSCFETRVICYTGRDWQNREEPQACNEYYHDKEREKLYEEENVRFDPVCRPVLRAGGSGMGV